jgi:uncharacterized protein YjbJ (UPF0337 family)
MISLTRIRGNWNALKGRLKQALASITDNDLMFDNGKRDKLLGKLQIVLGRTEEKRTRIISRIPIR